MKESSLEKLCRISTKLLLKYHQLWILRESLWDKHVTYYKTLGIKYNENTWILYILSLHMKNVLPLLIYCHEITLFSVINTVASDNYLALNISIEINTYNVIIVAVHDMHRHKFAIM